MFMNWEPENNKFFEFVHIFSYYILTCVMNNSDNPFQGILISLYMHMQIFFSSAHVGTRMLENNHGSKCRPSRDKEKSQFI